MSDDRYTEEELRAKEEAYREYLRLREEAPKVSITETPYGASQLRKKQKEEEAARAAYQKAREEGRRGVKPKKRQSSAHPSGTKRGSGESDGMRPSGRSASKNSGSSRRGGSKPSESSRGRGTRSTEAARQSGARSTEASRPRGARSNKPAKERRSPSIPRPDKDRRNRKSRDAQMRPMAENSTIASTVSKTRKKKPSKLKSGILSNRTVRKIIIILAVLILAAIALFVGGFMVVANTLGSIGSLDMEKNNLAISNQAKSDLKDFKNIAVLGVDTRDMDDDSESRSDAMVVVSINKKTNEVRMFSVFRDTMLDLGGDHGLDKLTHAYSYGGAETTVAALNRNLDLNIRKAVVINWKTVAEVIDALGGITIDVQESEIDELNKYIKGTAKATGTERVDIEKPGKQTLNGAQAVTYARIRQDDVRGDYRRNERMKIVMATTFKKAKNADVFTLKRLCDSALPDAKTNLTTTEMIGMALNFKKYDMTSSTTGWPYDVEGWIGTAGGGAAWYGPPVTLESNVEKLYKEFFKISDYEPSEEVRGISNDISELTGLY